MDYFLKSGQRTKINLFLKQNSGLFWVIFKINLCPIISKNRTM